MEIRELTRLEQLEWLKDTLERELVGILEELDECNKEMMGSDDMEEFDKETVFNLVNRLNQIEVEKRKLDLEYNQIVQELWGRIPSLKTDCNIQPKPIQKKIGGLYDGTKNNSSN